MTIMRWILAAGMACALAWPTGGQASRTDILIGLDSKVGFGSEGQVNIAPGTDAVLVMDVADPAHPRIRASLPLMNSLLGPPTNLQITPDGRLGLVANSVVPLQDGTAWKSPPDNRLFVIDLAAEPPVLLDTVTVHQQPSGLAISRKGDLVLIANRAGKSVSVLSIAGTTVKLVGEVPTGNEVAGVAITPDGTRAFAVMNLVNKVAVLAIDGQKVTYDKALDIPASFNPYNIDVTPDGKFAIASSTGAGGINGDALTVIDTALPHPHVVALATAGRGAEGIAISPDGNWVITPLLLGSGDRPDAWSYSRQGAAALLRIAPDGNLHLVSRLPLGGVPEGIAYSPSGEYVYIGNYIDRNLQVFRIAGDRLVAAGEPIALPGQPASLRGPAR